MNYFLLLSFGLILSLLPVSLLTASASDRGPTPAALDEMISNYTQTGRYSRQNTSTEELEEDNQDKDKYDEKDIIQGSEDESEDGNETLTSRPNPNISASELQALAQDELLELLDLSRSTVIYLTGIHSALIEKQSPFYLKTKADVVRLKFTSGLTADEVVSLYANDIRQDLNLWTYYSVRLDWLLRNTQTLEFIQSEFWWNLLNSLRIQAKEIDTRAKESFSTYVCKLGKKISSAEYKQRKDLYNRDRFFNLKKSSRLCIKKQEGGRIHAFGHKPGEVDFYELVVKPALADELTLHTLQETVRWGTFSFSLNAIYQRGKVSSLIDFEVVHESGQIGKILLLFNDIKDCSWKNLKETSSEKTRLNLSKVQELNQQINTLVEFRVDDIAITNASSTNVTSIDAMPPLTQPTEVEMQIIKENIKIDQSNKSTSSTKSEENETLLETSQTDKKSSSIYNETFEDQTLAVRLEQDSDYAYETPVELSTHWALFKTPKNPREWRRLQAVKNAGLNSPIPAFLENSSGRSFGTPSTSLLQKIFLKSNDFAILEAIWHPTRATLPKWSQFVGAMSRIIKQTGGRINSSTASSAVDFHVGERRFTVHATHSNGDMYFEQIKDFTVPGLTYVGITPDSVELLE